MFDQSRWYRLAFQGGLFWKAYGVLHELISIIVESGGHRFVWHTDYEGKHTGFYVEGKKNIDLFIKVGGPTWIHSEDDSGVTISL